MHLLWRKLNGKDSIAPNADRVETIFCCPVADPAGGGSIGAMAPPGPDEPPKTVLKLTILDTYLKNFQPRFTQHDYFKNPKLHILHNYHKKMSTQPGDHFAGACML